MNSAAWIIFAAAWGIAFPFIWFRHMMMYARIHVPLIQQEAMNTLKPTAVAIIISLIVYALFWWFDFHVAAIVALGLLVVYSSFILIPNWSGFLYERKFREQDRRRQHKKEGATAPSEN